MHSLTGTTPERQETADPASFSTAAAHNFMEGAKVSGHSVELADLHAEGFDPRWSMADIEAGGKAHTMQEVAWAQARNGLSGVLLVPAGARSDEMETKGYRSALETAWINGTFGCFGLSPRKLELLCGSDGSAQRRHELLERSYRIGRDLPSPRSGG